MNLTVNRLGVHLHLDLLQLQIHPPSPSTAPVDDFRHHSRAGGAASLVEEHPLEASLAPLLADLGAAMASRRSKPGVGGVKTL